jgi:putative inorganic carbon (hco3(-)) transporter
MLLWLTILALAYKLGPNRYHEGTWVILAPLLLGAVVLALRKLWELPPSVTMCLALVLTLFSGGWSLMGLGGLPLDRLVVVVLLLQLLLVSPGAALTPRLRVRNVHLLLCLTIMFVIASAVAAHTLSNREDLLALIDQFGVTPYLAYFLAPSVFAREWDRRLLLAVLVGIGAYLGLTAIFESLGPHALVIPKYIVQTDASLPEGRAGGPFQSPVSDGFSTFACAAAAVMALGRWRARPARLFATSALVVCVFGCFLSLERGVWIAAAAGITIAAAVTARGRRLLIPGFAACVVAISGALVLSPALAGKVSTRVGYKTSVWDRQNQTAAGLRMVEAKPLFGFGWQRFTSDNQEYFRQAADYPLTGYSTPQRPIPLHDTYLGYAVELGLVGLLLWLASLFWGVGGAVLARGTPELRPWKLGLLAALVFFVVVAAFDPQQQPFPAILLWVWAGVAIGRAPTLAPAARMHPLIESGSNGLLGHGSAVAPAG